MSPLSDAQVASALTAAEVEDELAALAASLAGGHLTRGTRDSAVRGRRCGASSPACRRASTVPARSPIAIVEDLEAALDRVSAAAEAAQKEEAASLDEELERRGYDGRAAQTQRRRLAARHKRESTAPAPRPVARRHHRDRVGVPRRALRAGTGPQPRPGRARRARRPLRARRRGVPRRARDSMIVNEKGTLHLLRLLLALPPAAPLTAPPHEPWYVVRIACVTYGPPRRAAQPFGIVSRSHAGVAQSVEQLTRNEQVRGSNPLSGSNGLGFSDRLDGTCGLRPRSIQTLLARPASRRCSHSHRVRRSECSVDTGSHVGHPCEAGRRGRCSGAFTCRNACTGLLLPRRGSGHVDVRSALPPEDIQEKFAG